VNATQKVIYPSNNRVQRTTYQ